MRSLPVADPGVPDARSAAAYLRWVARKQAGTLLLGITYAVVWWLAMALVPAALGKGIDAVRAKDMPGLLTWGGVVFALGVVQAVAGILRHRIAVYTWLAAAYRTVQVTVRQATRLGATLPRRVSTGEVVSVGNSDIAHIGNAMDILLRGTGAVVAIVTVTVILIGTSLPLGLAVLVGVPAMAFAVAPLLRPLHRRQHAHRDLQGDLSTRAADIVAGLRVLRGVGGEEVFADRYREESQRVRHAGVRVAAVESTLEGAQILLPGLLTAGVTWLGATFAMRGQITPGQLVAFYGYATFLIAPMRALTEAADKLTKGHVAAGRVVRILSLRPDVEGGTGASPGGLLRDVASGVAVRPGVFTALVTATPEEAAAIAGRLGRYADGDVDFGDVPLDALPIPEVRRRILVADNDAKLFTGVLRDELDVTGRAGDEEIAAALHAACAEDIVEALPDGLDGRVAEAGREFSGGQRQRLRLARALVLDPEVLILVEPTSAVDAHSEARIADRLAKARAGRTTLVCTSSPLVLDRTDHVIYVEGGVVRAQGAHRELLASHPAYSAVVTRGEDT
ncbi:ABC-type multidrug transport system fused ATPase/permease subunit [Streptosporangium becharense]|uniref:ABC-type multidrug transport system fused ATPase/permease subunit n=1 Tax=Streptosporangium becharense TaxID=1816182 RepID=A0A7W9MI20_9ACTN|nr:ABC transporter ATP-binding protein [Streptosporangium becharense]MBB2913481.1 ABC-type multidrug transport system fused ATPase/permease subunit [Streptosporangium becharense]MBB5821171.1 ABC-type multidrug transport system fused ATPase/permease subunit [Streptosporangium becharense]